MPRYRSRIKFLNLIAIVVLLLLSACGDEHLPDYHLNMEDEIYETQMRILTMYALDWGGMLLLTDPSSTYLSGSTLGDGNVSRLLGLAETALNRSWQESGETYEFRLDLTTFLRHEIEEQQLRLQVKMMSGQGYDILSLNYQPLWSFAASGFLADIYELMEQDIHTNRDDFYTNILEAWEINGRLYSLPLAFAFDYVGINAGLPQSFIDRFMWYNRTYGSISIQALLRIYNDLMREYEEKFGHLHLGNSAKLLSPVVATGLVMSEYIDFDNGTSYLNSNTFIEFLHELRLAFDITDVTSPRSAIENDIINFLNDDVTSLAFWSYTWWNCRVFTLFPESDMAVYINFTPIGNQNGQLILNQSTGWVGLHNWLALSVGVQADNVLAWEFIKHLMTTSIGNTGDAFVIGGHYSLSTPIKKEYFLPHLRPALRNILREPGLSQVIDYLDVPHPIIAGDELMNMATTQIEANHNKPAKLAHFISREFYKDLLVELFTDSITPNDMAEELHNRISLFLLEIG